MPSDKTQGDTSFSTFFTETGTGKYVPRYVRSIQQRKSAKYL
jgi:hypothetical protein